MNFFWWQNDALLVPQKYFRGSKSIPSITSSVTLIKLIQTIIISVLERK